ncbi:MAG: retention module-containing protein [Gammaproteobacteria bacterium]|nr:retention module-containing protein [Gammaproteobacteria bacterium]MBP6053262.1 retention module-containing protein [Pseudomonadales bacterium]MBK7171381.1 retention module-containing protein [Gammaproteobacteria bacterium]MBK7521452.1 retention module-containing protein [Gammaproteobacteria bacterium]MBK7729230.1 retention module-containing protein [Gammaproteobacteria bacterium]
MNGPGSRDICSRHNPGDTFIMASALSRQPGTAPHCSKVQYAKPESRPRILSRLDNNAEFLFVEERVPMPAGVIVGTLKSVTGKAFARDESGNIRPLRSGDSVHEGETLVTGQGARAELVFVDASSLAIGEGRTISISPELLLEGAPDAAESSLSASTVDEVLRALPNGQNLSEEMDVTAAGLGGATDAQGFVRVLRIADGTEPLAFRFDGTSREASEVPPEDGLGFGPTSPASPPPRCH